MREAVRGGPTGKEEGKERAIPLQRPDFQSRGSYGLRVSGMDINFARVVSALFNLYAPLRSSSRSLRGLR